jgi:hypothetical protein
LHASDTADARNHPKQTTLAEGLATRMAEGPRVEGGHR